MERKKFTYSSKYLTFSVFITYPRRCYREHAYQQNRICLPVERTKIYLFLEIFYVFSRFLLRTLVVVIASTCTNKTEFVWQSSVVSAPVKQLNDYIIVIRRRWKWKGKRWQTWGLAIRWLAGFQGRKHV